MRLRVARAICIANSIFVFIKIRPWCKKLTWHEFWWKRSCQLNDLDLCIPSSHYWTTAIINFFFWNVENSSCCIFSISHISSGLYWAIAKWGDGVYGGVSFIMYFFQFLSITTEAVLLEWYVFVLKRIALIVLKLCIMTSYRTFYSTRYLLTKMKIYPSLVHCKRAHEWRYCFRNKHCFSINPRLKSLLFA